MSRIVRVSTTAFHNSGGPTIEDNIRKAADLVDWAALDRPDLVCLPETFAYLGVPHKSAEEVAEPIPGPITEMARTKARRHGVNIVCPLLERRDDGIYNVAAVINRSGELVGTYEKLHPVTSSFDFTQFEGGVRPGREPKVFDLDFGRIGVLICFDINWHEDWLRTARKGAEIIVWCSAYDGGFHLRVLAFLCHRYIVSAVKSRHAAIIDMDGRIIDQTEAPEAVITADLNLEKTYLHLDFNGSQIPAIKEKHGPDVAIRRYHSEGGMIVESRRPGLTVKQLMEQFDLESIPDYIARHEKAEQFTREGKPAPAQPPRRVPEQYSGHY